MVSGGSSSSVTRLQGSVSGYSVTRLQAPGLQLWAEADLLRVERRKGVVKPGLSLPSRNGSVVGKE